VQLEFLAGGKSAWLARIKMNKIIEIIFACLAIIVVGLSNNLYAKTTIQRSFLKKADFNSDGKLEEVHLIIYGENIKKPFQWDLSIKIEGHTIFHRYCDDSWLDDFFHDPTYYSDNGATYEAQKQEYYFKDLPEKVVSYIKVSDEEWKKDDFWLRKYVEKNIQDELSSKHDIVGQKAQTIIKAAIYRLTRGIQTLSISCNPLTGTEDFMFLPGINSFVMYYAP